MNECCFSDKNLSHDHSSVLALLEERGETHIQKGALSVGVLSMKGILPSRQSRFDGVMEF